MTSLASNSQVGRAYCFTHAARWGAEGCWHCPSFSRLTIDSVRLALLFSFNVHMEADYGYCMERTEKRMAHTSRGLLMPLCINDAYSVIQEWKRSRGGLKWASWWNFTRRREVSYSPLTVANENQHFIRNSSNKNECSVLRAELPFISSVLLSLAYRHWEAMAREYLQ